MINVRLKGHSGFGYKKDCIQHNEIQHQTIRLNSVILVKVYKQWGSCKKCKFI